MKKYAKNFANCFLLIPLVIFWGFIFLNIESVGDFGVGLPILITFVSLSSVMLLFKYLRHGVVLKNSLLLFIILILWISIRFLADFHELDALKQHTVATTGGMLLFYIIGLLIREVLNMQKIDHKKKFLFYGFVYLFYVFFVLISFSNRLSINVFLLKDLDGAYQRAGNLMTMSFVVFSFIYVTSNINSQSAVKKSIYLLSSTCIYFSCAGLLFLESQLMGSNSATLIVFVLTLISVSVSLLLSSKNIFNQYKKKTGRVFEFKNIFFAAVGRLMTGIYFVIACLTAAIIYFDLDIKKMRVFGFGDAENSSLNSRFEILSQWGGEQLTYAPILGNVNVAYLVTGDAGLTLHNFFPNIQASLGLIGSTIVLMIFFQVFKSVYSEATKKYNTASVDGFVKSSIAFYSILVILFTLIIANLSSGFSWPVMWFVVGFLSNSLSIPSRSSIIN